jgi:hypothetical protein
VEYIAYFSHVQHIGQEMTCESCHAGVEQSVKHDEQHLPSMASCYECHADVGSPDYCGICHAAGEDLLPGDHRLDWVKAHGISSQTGNEACEMCHTELQCLECHQGDNLDQQAHPLNFRNNHALAARGNKDNCLTCHEEFQFCVECHQREFVIPRNHARAGWSNLTTKNQHARTARMDFDSCLSCHSESIGEPVCVQCHPAQ